MEEEKKTRQEGMTRRGKIILTVFAGAIIVFLIWWLIPRSFEGITGMKGIQPQKISCTIQPADIEAAPADNRNGFRRDCPILRLRGARKGTGCGYGRR